MPPILSNLFLAGLWAAACGLGLATLAGFLGRRWWRFEQFCHFRLQYAVLLALVGVVFLAAGEIAGALFSKLLALLNLALILPVYLPRIPHPPAPRPKAGEKIAKMGVLRGKATQHTHFGEEFLPSQREEGAGGDGAVFRLVHANVLGENDQYQHLIDLVRAENPDIITLAEPHGAWMGAILPALSPAYPHHRYEAFEDNYGIAVFSRTPFTRAETHWFGPARLPTLVIGVELAGQPLTLIATHPPPPKSLRETIKRDRQMAEIAAFALAQPGPLLLAGDLNMSSWSYAFGDLLRGSRLHDSRQGIGIQPSWPAQRPWFLIPLDHILHTPDITIHRRRIGPNIGSDHLPVVVDFSM